jgi:MFS family permease
MVFLCVLAFLTYFDRVCIMQAQGDIQRDLHLSDAAMGWVLGAFWLAYGLFEIPGGWLGDRFGARKGLTRIVLAWSVFTALSGCAVGLFSLLTWRFLFGIGEAGAFPNMARVQSRWLPQNSRARWGGLLWLVARWGGGLAAPIFAWLLLTLGSPRFRAFVNSSPLLHPLANVPAWRMGFWLCGFAGLAWVLMFYPWFRDDPAQKTSVNRAELELIRRGNPAHTDAPKDRRARTPWAALFSSPALWALGIGYFGSSFGWSFFVSWMPKYFLQVHHVPIADSRWLSAMPLLLQGLGCVTGGYLSDLMVRVTGWRRLGRAIFPISGCTTAAVAMFCIRFTHTPHEAVVLMCVATFALDFGQAANWATVIDIGGAFAGTAFGFMNMVGNLGNFLQPRIGAAIFNHLGWDPLFVTYSGAFLLAAFMWLFIDPRRRFYADERSV